MRQLAKRDLDMVVRRIPSDVRSLMRDSPLFIAGGFIREVISGQPVNDIDMFGPDLETLRAAATRLLSVRENREESWTLPARLHETEFAITVLSPPRTPVQFIHKWLYSDPNKLLAELDFTVCQACVFRTLDGRWDSLCADDFYSDLAAHRLVYTFPVRAEAAGGSLMRVRKFLARGYNIQTESLGGVISRLVDGVHEERLGLVMKNEGLNLERARAKVITGLLREVDPLLIVDAVEPQEEEPQ